MVATFTKWGIFPVMLFPFLLVPRLPAVSTMKVTMYFLLLLNNYTVLIASLTLNVEKFVCLGFERG